MLEHHADVAPRYPQGVTAERRQFAPADDHLAGRRAVQQVDDTDQRTFAGAAAADDAEDLARLDVKVDAAKRFDGAGRPLVRLKNTLELDH